MKETTPAWSELLAHDLKDSTMLKEETSSCVCLLTHQNRLRVLKIYPCVSLRERIKFWAGRDRATTNARHAATLIKAGLLPDFTPHIHHGLWKHKPAHMLLVPWFEGVSGLSVFGEHSQDRTQDRQHAQHVVALLVALAQKGLYYRDWNFSNFLLTPTQAWLIDWDDLRQVPSWGRKKIYQKMKKRVLHNWSESQYLALETKKEFEAWFTHHERHGIVATM